MAPETLTGYAMSAVFVLVMIIIGFIWLAILRGQYRRQAEKKIRLGIIGKDNQEMLHWGHIEGLTIVDEQTEQTYALANVRFIQSWYPEGGIFKGLGASVQKAFYVEGMPDAYIKKNYDSDPVNITELAKQSRKEKFMAVANGAIAQIEDAVGKVKKGEINAVAFYMIGIIIIAGVGVAIYYGWTIVQKLSALGV